MGYGQDTPVARGLAVGTPIDETRSAIRDGLSNSEQLLSELHGAIDVLEKRLDTVLVPTPPSTSPLAQTSAPALLSSQVRGRIDIMNEGYLHANARLRALMARIDV